MNRLPFRILACLSPTCTCTSSADDTGPQTVLLATTTSHRNSSSQPSSSRPPSPPKCPRGPVTILVALPPGNQGPSSSTQTRSNANETGTTVTVTTTRHRHRRLLAATPARQTTTSRPFRSPASLPFPSYWLPASDIDTVETGETGALAAIPWPHPRPLAAHHRDTGIALQCGGQSAFGI